jgi:sugar phosphate isomerase/epimerase/type 1 glutamine amidotransferase
MMVAGGLTGSAQTPAPGARQRPPQPAAPPAPSLSVRPSGSSLGTIRLGGADERIWFGWRVGIPSAAFKQLTFAEAVVKADALGLGSIEGSSTQKVAYEIPKNLDYHLAPGERTAVTNQLREYNVQLAGYRVDNLGADEAERRKIFEFAKAVGVQIIFVNPEQASLAEIDKLADEFGISVALENHKDAKSLMSMLEGRSKRIGLQADLGGWMHEGIKPVDALPLVKDRLLAVDVRDRSALGAKGRDVTAGSGAAGLSDFFVAAYRAGIKPLFITIDATGAADTYADLAKSLDNLEKFMLPAMALRVNQMLDSPEGKIRGGDRLSPDMRKQIDAAVPREAMAKPKKPRKLLVTDIQMYSGHGTIPHANYMLELMAKYTGAFEPVFSNDLSNLKYPKIKEFDAVFLNSVCGMVWPHPDVREGILRYVREGGGLAGNHAVTYANLNWPEFVELMGAWAGAHHTEKQVLKIDDPNSPLTAMFGGMPIEHQDEFYHFPAFAPYTREKQHVLLSIDVERSDLATAGRLCTQCTRPDNDYAMAWVKSYGKGRVYITPLGHTPILYTDPRWTKHLLGAVQYALGDLDVDATPSAKLSAKKK